MALLDDALNMLGGARGSGQAQGSLVPLLISMLTGGGGAAASASSLPGLGSLTGGGAPGGAAGFGGLGGLVAMLAQNGLGDVVNSWVSTGANQPVTADQLRSAFGSERIGQLAASAGVSDDAALDQLTRLLPTMVDKLTPGGSVPSGNLADQGMALLKELTS